MGDAGLPFPSPLHHKTYDSDVQSRIADCSEQIYGMVSVFDDRKTGHVSSEEFKLALELLGFNIQDKSIQLLVKFYEKDRKIDYQSLLKAVGKADGGLAATPSAPNRSLGGSEKRTRNPMMFSPRNAPLRSHSSSPASESKLLAPTPPSHFSKHKSSSKGDVVLTPRESRSNVRESPSKVRAKSHRGPSEMDPLEGGLESSVLKSANVEKTLQELVEVLDNSDLGKSSERFPVKEADGDKENLGRTDWKSLFQTPVTTRKSPKKNCARRRKKSISPPPKQKGRYKSAFEDFEPAPSELDEAEFQASRVSPDRLLQPRDQSSGAVVEERTNAKTKTTATRRLTESSVAVPSSDLVALAERVGKMDHQLQSPAFQRWRQTAADDTSKVSNSLSEALVRIVSRARDDKVKSKVLQQFKQNFRRVNEKRREKLRSRVVSLEHMIRDRSSRTSHQRFSWWRAFSRASVQATLTLTAKQIVRLQGLGVLQMKVRRTLRILRECFRQMKLRIGSGPKASVRPAISAQAAPPTRLLQTCMFAWYRATQRTRVLRTKANQAIQAAETEHFKCMLAKRAFDRTRLFRLFQAWVRQSRLNEKPEKVKVADFSPSISSNKPDKDSRKRKMKNIRRRRELAMTRSVFQTWMYHRSLCSLERAFCEEIVDLQEQVAQATGKQSPAVSRNALIANSKKMVVLTKKFASVWRDRRQVSLAFTALVRSRSSGSKPAPSEHLQELVESVQDLRKDVFKRQIVQLNNLRTANKEVRLHLQLWRQKVGNENLGLLLQNARDRVKVCEEEILRLMDARKSDAEVHAAAIAQERHVQKQTVQEIETMYRNQYEMDVNNIRVASEAELSSKSECIERLKKELGATIEKSRTYKRDLSSYERVWTRDRRMELTRKCLSSWFVSTIREWRSTIATEAEGSLGELQTQHKEELQRLRESMSSALARRSSGLLALNPTFRAWHLRVKQLKIVSLFLLRRTVRVWRRATRNAHFEKFAQENVAVKKSLSALQARMTVVFAINLTSVDRCMCSRVLRRWYYASNLSLKKQWMEVAETKNNLASDLNRSVDLLKDRSSTMTCRAGRLVARLSMRHKKSSSLSMALGGWRWYSASKHRKRTIRRAEGVKRDYLEAFEAKSKALSKLEKSCREHFVTRRDLKLQRRTFVALRSAQKRNMQLQKMEENSTLRRKKDIMSRLEAFSRRAKSNKTNVVRTFLEGVIASAKVRICCTTLRRLEHARAWEFWGRWRRCHFGLAIRNLQIEVSDKQSQYSRMWHFLTGFASRTRLNSMVRLCFVSIANYARGRHTYRRNKMRWTEKFMQKFFAAWRLSTIKCLRTKASSLVEATSRSGKIEGRAHMLRQRLLAVVCRSLDRRVLSRVLAILGGGKMSVFEIRRQMTKLGREHKRYVLQAQERRHRSTCQSVFLSWRLSNALSLMARGRTDAEQTVRAEISKAKNSRRDLLLEFRALEGDFLVNSILRLWRGYVSRKMWRRGRKQKRLSHERNDRHIHTLARLCRLSERDRLSGFHTALLRWRTYSHRMSWRRFHDVARAQQKTSHLLANCFKSLRMAAVFRSDGKKMASILRNRGLRRFVHKTIRAWAQHAKKVIKIAQYSENLEERRSKNTLRRILWAMYRLTQRDSGSKLCATQDAMVRSHVELKTTNKMGVVFRALRLHSTMQLHEEFHIDLKEQNDRMAEIYAKNLVHLTDQLDDIKYQNVASRLDSLVAFWFSRTSHMAFLVWKDVSKESKLRQLKHAGVMSSVCHLWETQTVIRRSACLRAFQALRAHVGSQRGHEDERVMVKVFSAWMTLSMFQQQHPDLNSLEVSEISNIPKAEEDDPTAITRYDFEQRVGRVASYYDSRLSAKDSALAHLADVHEQEKRRLQLDNAGLSDWLRKTRLEMVQKTLSAAISNWSNLRRMDAFSKWCSLPRMVSNSQVIRFAQTLSSWTEKYQASAKGSALLRLRLNALDSKHQALLERQDQDHNREANIRLRRIIFAFHVAYVGRTSNLKAAAHTFSHWRTRAATEGSVVVTRNLQAKRVKSKALPLVLLCVRRWVGKRLQHSFNHWTQMAISWRAEEMLSVGVGDLTRSLHADMHYVHTDMSTRLGQAESRYTAGLLSIVTRAHRHRVLWRAVNRWRGLMR